MALTSSSLVRSVVLAFFILAPSFSEIGALADVEPGRNWREFDYFTLAVQWPPTYCRGTHHCCSRNACCRGENAPFEFTIHGLWPDYNDGSWPSCCYQSEFDKKEISTLVDALEKYWPTLSCGKPRSCYGRRGSFWGHEWEKHGTCSSPVISNEYDYFLTGLNVYFKYNITSVLFEAGYVPSNSEKYPIGGIVSAIQNAFHVNPLVVCKRGSLEEVRLCFYKDFKPRDCVAPNDVSSSSCPSYVSLPTYASWRLDGGESADSSSDGVLRAPKESLASE